MWCCCRRQALVELVPLQGDQEWRALGVRGQRWCLTAQAARPHFQNLRQQYLSKKKIKAAIDYRVGYLLPGSKEPHF
ncbi:hypothetical protein GQ55_2G418400 [Panicum hallii var. hallii]|uniref:Uncharacterized protein n=1 Tax=Panicum hallii var. hallii TaxID=1504633 RepID=A0A2T7EY34_9POAL|nr:hypothetical protein GQ55_2G418400 [Panicum hallii var. hallii]